MNHFPTRTYEPRWLASVIQILCHEEWNIGFVKQTAADIVRNGLIAPVEWSRDWKPGEIFADPAYIECAGSVRKLYAERMKSRDTCGEIWSAELKAGQAVPEAVFSPLVREPFHLSFPQPFLADDGRLMLTAESWQANSALLWHHGKAISRNENALLNGRPVIDPTLWWSGGRVWLFCSFKDDCPDSRLYLYHSSRIGELWIPHPANPIKNDRSSARSAGPLFVANGMLVRSAQDCSRTYGGAVVLNEVTRLEPEVYSEQCIRRIDPVPGQFGSGLHTFCPAGEYTLIDGKIWRHDPVVLANRIRRRVMTFFRSTLSLRQGRYRLPGAAEAISASGQADTR